MAKTQPIGDWIRSNRIANEMTQNDLAKKLGRVGMSISYWENGKGQPNDEDMRVLTKLFGARTKGTPAQLEEDSFGAWLRRELKRRDMTLQELSDASGVGIANLSLIQTGKIQRPQRKTIERIESVLKRGSMAKDQGPPEPPPQLSETAGEDLAIGEWLEVGKEDKENWPTLPGIYILYDVAKRPTYVGKGKNIRDRLRDHSSRGWWLAGPTVETIAYIVVKDEKLRSRLEELFITFANGNILVNKNLVERD